MEANCANPTNNPECQEAMKKREELIACAKKSKTIALSLEAHLLLLKEAGAEAKNHLNEANRRPYQWLALGVGLLMASLSLRKEGPHFLVAGCTLSFGCYYQAWKKGRMAKEQLSLANNKLSKCNEVREICKELRKDFELLEEQFNKTNNRKLV